MGDKIAILQVGGVLAQYDTPEKILTHPASDFVNSFVGTDRVLKRLSLLRLRDIELEPANGDNLPRISDRLTLRDALSAIIGAGADKGLVCRENNPGGDQGQVCGTISVDTIREISRDAEVTSSGG